MGGRAARLIDVSTAQGIMARLLDCATAGEFIVRNLGGFRTYVRNVRMFGNIVFGNIMFGNIVRRTYVREIPKMVLV